MKRVFVARDLTEAKIVNDLLEGAQTSSQKFATNHRLRFIPSIKPKLKRILQFGSETKTLKSAVSRGHGKRRGMARGGSSD
jgi:hypothetical protein